MQFNDSEYFQRIDNYEKPIPAAETVSEDAKPEDGLDFTPKEIGTTTNPMGNTLESLKAKIKHGTGRIEFGFMGQGKGNRQQPTPESYGERERQDIRELLKVNKMNSSTHAAVHSDSLAGFTREGFNEQARGQALKEIKKAIDFASEATRGGPVVFHVGEWYRPMDELSDDEMKFEGYPGEEESAVKFAVDTETGRPIGQIRKDKDIYRPEFRKVKDLDETEKEIYGIPDDAPGDKYPTVDGQVVDEEDAPRKLLKRIPKWNEQEDRFETKALDWEELKRRAEKQGMKPEKYYAQVELQNQALQQRGQSQFHSRDFRQNKEELERLQETKSFYKKQKEKMDSGQEWKALSLIEPELAQQARRQGKDPEKFLDEQIDRYKQRLRYTQEASSSADVQAKEIEDKLENIQAVDEYGMDKTADTISRAAEYAMERYEQNKDKYEFDEPLYVAPENWDPKNYGSHPEEYKKIIQKSREKFVKDLQDKGRVASEEEARELAQKHIKGTLDIGHLNLFREHYNESESKKDFEDWMLEQAEELVENDYVGHIHVTDNFGFDDEHLTPGEGNIPMKKFLKKMEEQGMENLIVEPGSFNIETSYHDTLSLSKSPIYGNQRRPRANNIRQEQFGYDSPGLFIAGSYSPSNDWSLWSEVPLE